MRSAGFAILLLLFTSRLGNAQVNLVPNPSFEQYSACPSTLDQLTYAIGWTSYGGTPDYFNSCDANGLSVPHNGIGYQDASNGNAYAGFVAYTSNGFAREIVGTQLTQNLAIGVKYYVSIKVSLAEFQPPPPQFIPCDKIGVKFSSVQFSAMNWAPINNSAHIYSSTIVSDTMNWVTIKGSFISDSAYQHIMIGNFFDDAQTDTINMPNGVYSYFFVDEVCVSTDSLTCNGPIGIGETNQHNTIDIFPNPVSDFFDIRTETNDEWIIYIYNSSGSEVFQSRFKTSARIDCRELPCGAYFVRLHSGQKYFSRKIIINPK